MRKVLSLCLVFGAGAAEAEPPDLGCYQRAYTEEHLAENPQQHVAALRLKIYASTDPNYPFADLDVRLRDGSFHGQTLVCFGESETPFCGVECDGGSMVVTRQDDEALVFRTSYLMVGDSIGCGGAVDLAEVPGELVSYRLNRSDPAVCEGD